MQRFITTTITAFLLTQMAIAGNTIGNGVVHVETKKDTLPPGNGFTVAFSWMPSYLWDLVTVKKDDPISEPIVNMPVNRMLQGKCGSHFEELVILQLTFGPEIFETTGDENEELPIRTGTYVNESGDTVVQIKLLPGSGWDNYALSGPIQQECVTREPMPWEDGYNWLQLDLIPEPVAEEADTSEREIGKAAYAEKGKVTGNATASFYTIQEDLCYEFSELGFGVGYKKLYWSVWLEGLFGGFATKQEEFGRRESGLYAGTRINASLSLAPNRFRAKDISSGLYFAFSCVKVIERSNNSLMELGENQKYINFIATFEPGLFISWKRLRLQVFSPLWAKDQGSYELVSRGVLGEGAPQGDKKEGGYGVGFRFGYTF